MPTTKNVAPLLLSLALCTACEKNIEREDPPATAEAASKESLIAPGSGALPAAPPVAESTQDAPSMMPDKKPSDGGEDTAPTNAYVARVESAKDCAPNKSYDDVKYDPALHGGGDIEGYEHGFDWDVTITPTIECVDTTGKLADEGKYHANVMFDGQDEMLGHVTWTDRLGTNLLLYSKKSLKDGGVMLYAEVATFEGSAWVVRRQFKDIVNTCDFDIVLRDHLDPAWAITDLDDDGIADVALAWTIDCTSDVSPNTHKVILYSGAGEKYALRGVTSVDPGGGRMGGDYTVDDAFKKAPAGFLDHAKMVWAKTSAQIW